MTIYRQTGEPFTKQPSEQYAISTEFSGALVSGESISTLTVTAYDEDNNDVTSTIIESSSIDGTEGLAVVKSGTDKETYKITFLIETSLGNKYEDDQIMNVLEM